MGTGKYGLDTIRDKFADTDKYKVMLIFDVWKEEGKPARTQVRLPYMNIEDVVEKYGDFIYDCWYTEGFENGRTVASLWAMADEKHAVDPWLYEHWPELWKDVKEVVE